MPDGSIPPRRRQGRPHPERPHRSNPISSTEQVAAAQAFLKTLHSRAEMNAAGLKHNAENWATAEAGRHVYISQTALVEAALRSGWRVRRRWPDGPHFVKR